MRIFIGDCLKLPLGFLVALDGAGEAKLIWICGCTLRANGRGIRVHRLSDGCAGLYVLLRAPVSIGSGADDNQQHHSSEEDESLTMGLRLLDGSAGDFLEFVFF